MFARLRNSIKIFSILCDASRSQKSKMAARLTNRKYLYLRLYTSLLKNSKSNSHVSEVNEFEKAISMHTVWCKRMSEIQYGRLTRGNINSSAYIQHSCKLRGYTHVFWDWEIPLSGFPYCVTQADISNPKWRITHRKYLYLSRYTIELLNSNGYTHVFKVQEFN